MAKDDALPSGSFSNIKPLRPERATEAPKLAGLGALRKLAPERRVVWRVPGITDGETDLPAQFQSKQAAEEAIEQHISGDMLSDLEGYIQDSLCEGTTRDEMITELARNYRYELPSKWRTWLKQQTEDEFREQYRRCIDDAREEGVDFCATMKSAGGEYLPELCENVKLKRRGD